MPKAFNEIPRAPRAPELPSYVTDHIERVRDRFSTRMEEKYLKGQEEHGGDLSTKESIVWLLDMMEDEAIDQFVYVQTLRERILGREQ